MRKITRWWSAARWAANRPLLEPPDFTPEFNPAELATLLHPEAGAGFTVIEFQTAFLEAPVAIALADAEGRFLRVNRALGELLGQPASALTGRDLLSFVHADAAAEGAAAFRELAAGCGERFQIETRLVNVADQTLWALLSVARVPGAGGAPASCIIHLQDISERHRLEQHLAYLAEHDPLTGLLNRRRFEASLEEHSRVLQRYGGRGAVLVLDLDRFKEVNDCFGHQAGDEVLKGVAAMLRQRVRSSDTIARLGGDEFALFLPQASEEDAKALAADLVSALGRTYASASAPAIPVTVSVGVAALSGAGEGHALVAADLAMYHAKRSGGNAWADASSVIGAPGAPPWRAVAVRGVGRRSRKLMTPRRGTMAALGCAATFLAARRWAHLLGRRIVLRPT